MKLVEFKCTVNVERAKENGEMQLPKPHTIWINPEDIQMVAPRDNKQPDIISIIFRNQGGSTTVEGTLEEITGKLTTA